MKPSTFFIKLLQLVAVFSLIIAVVYFLLTHEPEPKWIVIIERVGAVIICILTGLSTYFMLKGMKYLKQVEEEVKEEYNRKHQ